MIRIVVVAYDDENDMSLVCRTQDRFEIDETPYWDNIIDEYEEQLNTYFRKIT